MTLALVVSIFFIPLLAFLTLRNSQTQLIHANREEVRDASSDLS